MPDLRKSTHYIHWLHALEEICIVARMKLVEHRNEYPEDDDDLVLTIMNSAMNQVHKEMALLASYESGALSDST
jgi:hypothetical protein